MEKESTYFSTAATSDPVHITQLHLFLTTNFLKLQREINVRKGKFTPLKDSWFELEMKETNGDTKVRLKADEKMYDQWKTKLENAFKMPEEPEDKFSSDDESERKEPLENNFCHHNCQALVQVQIRSLDKGLTLKSQPSTR